MQSLKNIKSKPVGRPPKLIKPYRYSKRNAVLFLIIIILGLLGAFKFGLTIGRDSVPAEKTAAPAEVTPTPIPSILTCDPFTTSITDGKVEKFCNLTPTPTPTPQPAKRSLKPSDEEIVAYIRSKDWDDSTAVRVAKSENFYNYSNSFDCTRQGALNDDGTRDHGLWQINDIHIRSGAITLEDTLDCQKSTDFAYRLYKGRGNWSAWSAYTNLSYLNHSDSL